jgi:hypothetical protein
MPGGEHRRPDVHRHDALPGLEIHGRGTSAAAGQGNVVHHSVEAAQRAGSFLDTARAVGFARQVADHRDTLTAGLADQADGRRRPFGGYVGYRDPGALAREENGDRLTDTEQVTTGHRASAGDERPLAGQAVSRISAPPPRLIIHLDNITQCETRPASSPQAHDRAASRDIQHRSTACRRRPGLSAHRRLAVLAIGQVPRHKVRSAVVIKVVATCPAGSDRPV